MPARRTTPTAADSLASDVAELYALPLGEFTAARNALAARLRKAGDRDGAAEVQGLVKPTPAAWAVNQLLRRERTAFDALLATGGRARAALGRTLTGAGPEVVREALAEVRQRREQLLRRGADLLAGDGRAASATQLERLAVDLEAMALSPAAQEAVARGWLDRDLDPPGFEVLAGLQLAALPPRRPAPAPAGRMEPEKAPARAEPAVPPARGKAPTAADREEKAAREREEREVARQRERRARLQEKVDQRAQEAEELEVQAGTAEHEAKVAETEARQAERAAAEARRRAEQTREAATRARERAGRAAERLAQAQSDLTVAAAQE